MKTQRPQAASRQHGGEYAQWITNKRFEMFANSNFYHREGDYSQNHIDQQFRSTGYSNDPYGWRISTGFIYHVSERFGVKVAGEFEKYDSALLLGGRFMF